MQAVISRFSTPRKVIRITLSFLGLLVLFIILWEAYKAMGKASNGMVPFLSVQLPVSPRDIAMPHVWDIVGSLVEPAQRGSDTILLTILLENAVFTFREAIAGFLIGSTVGFGLAVVFVLSAPLERGLMPYVIASQTIPLLAIAPMVVIWGGKIGLPVWASVSIIAAYLSFFPVTINTVRGLRSPSVTAVELMSSYAASRREILWKLQIPASLPYVFTALKIAATASVIGAIIGELPASLNFGLGRSLLTFSYYFQSGPERLFAAILIAALLGITTVGLVSIVERLAVPPARRLEE
jgi:NitT/TauT family transport system permease protein